MQPDNPPSAGRRAVASGPRSKYAPRACQECRRRRAKCDGQKPSCARCLSRGKACVFTSEPDNRGSAPKSYVALLQARIKLLEEVLMAHSIDIDASVAQLDAQRTEVDPDPPAASAAYSSSTAFEEMCAELEGALYLDDPLGEPEKPTGEARFFGLSSGRLELQSSNDVPADQSPGLEASPSTDYQSTSTRQFHTNLPERGVSTQDLDDLVSPGLKDRLIDLYFEWEQPWFTLVDERLFRESMRGNGRYSSPLLICCILALGARYSSEKEACSDQEDPNTAGRAFAERAEILLRSEIGVPSITTIQALGVLGSYHVGVGAESLGWQYHGMANRMLLDVGLNLDSSTVTSARSWSSEDVRLRRQIYWALYCNDKFWASFSGRVCTMLDSQGAVPLPAMEIADDTLGDDRSQFLLRLHHAKATHCQILEKVLMNMLPSASERRAFFDSCILTLQGWYYSLPKDLKAMAPTGPNDAPSPHAFILNMVYNTSVVLLAKPFLKSHRTHEKGAVHVPPGDQDDVFQHASTLCLEAAGEICLLTRRYRELFGSFRRSPLTATHCTLTAALVIMFVRPVAEGAASPADSAELDGCMQTLRELSVSWGPPLRYWRAISKILSGQSPRGSTEPATKGLVHAGAPSDASANAHGEMLPGPAVQRPACGRAWATNGGGETPQYFKLDTPAAFTESPCELLWSRAVAPDVPMGVGFLQAGAFDAMPWDDRASQDAVNHFWGHEEWP